ncbi:MAG TPA: hypothetical protein VGC44_14905, partial [Longimicrobiales bacterium]
MKRFLFSLTIALVPLTAQAQEHKHAGNQVLGSVNFSAACNAEAQKHVSTGVAMLHSFWFPEACKTFEAAAAADPSCGIAYWGIALTHFTNPIAGGSGAPSHALGWQAAEKGAAIGAKTERDRAYIDAAVALFRDYDKVDNRTRMRR